ncbi:MAG: DUF362 domain-containing protein [Planctomycetota bacterium]
MKQKAIVLIESLCDIDQSLEAGIYRSCKQVGLERDIESAKAIFIKPNLTYPVYKRGVTTRKEFVEGLVGVLRNMNPVTKIYIGEGEGGYNSFPMTDAMREMGFFEIAEKYSNVEIINISRLPSRTIELTARDKPYPIALPALFLDEIDFSITCPVPKVHGMTRITLSLKNQWGCLPDVMRLKNHYVFNEIIGQICDKLKFRYAFLDGKYGLDNNGPMVGNPVELNWFAASNSLGAFDVIVAEMMGFDWRKVRHLKMASKYGFVPDRSDIEVIGDIRSLQRRFSLNRNFWHYPALIAFHSKRLTNLFYLSRYAKILHDIMYTFRERPIDPGDNSA